MSLGAEISGFAFCPPGDVKKVASVYFMINTYAKGVNESGFVYSHQPDMTALGHLQRCYAKFHHFSLKLRHAPKQRLTTWLGLKPRSYAEHLGSVSRRVHTHSTLDPPHTAQESDRL